LERQRKQAGVSTSARVAVVGRGNVATPADSHLSTRRLGGGGGAGPPHTDVRAMSGTERRSPGDGAAASISAASDAQRRLATTSSWHSHAVGVVAVGESADR